MQGNPLPRIHLIGIAGTGLSAIARILHARGYRVTGCDRNPGPNGEALRRLGIPVYTGHDPAHVREVDMVLHTSALREHPELEAARARGIPVFTRSRFLPLLTQGYRTLAVAGTHGKTTTTAMLAWVLGHLGLDPTYIVGGTLRNTGTNGHAGSGPFFVIEADEYDHMFLGLTPEAAILTSVDYDHPDFFPTREAYRDAFRAFVAQVQGDVLFWNENTEAQQVVKVLPVSRRMSYGVHPPADYLAVVERREVTGTVFSVQVRGKPLVQVRVPLPGMHNVRNALAVLALVHRLGLDVAAAAEALAQFAGVERRFTVVAQGRGWVLVNDYGHHPVEIRTTLEAARQRFPNHALWAVWQPHTYSRTLRLLPEFVQALAQADGIVVTGIYAARETPPPDFSKDILPRAFSALPAFFVEKPLDAVPLLAEAVRPPAVVLLFSAGDAPVMLAHLARILHLEET